MARRNDSWFEFNAQRSTDLGVRLMDASRSVSPAQRGSRHTVAGRGGSLWLSDNCRSDFDLTRSCRAAASRLRDVRSWLRGAGTLRFSCESDALYDARVSKNIEFRQILPGDDPVYEFSVTFTCQPCPAVYPAAEPAVFTEPGALAVPENCFGLPRVEIAGSGCFSLTIGMQTMFFSDVEGGVIVDSALGDALTAGGTQLANGCVTGALYRIEPGQGGVSWIAGGTAEDGTDLPGEVTRVTVAPGWRHV